MNYHPTFREQKPNSHVNLEDKNNFSRNVGVKILSDLYTQKYFLRSFWERNDKKTKKKYFLIPNIFPFPYSHTLSPLPHFANPGPTLNSKFNFTLLIIKEQHIFFCFIFLYVNPCLSSLINIFLIHGHSKQSNFIQDTVAYIVRRFQVIKYEVRQ